VRVHVTPVVVDVEANDVVVADAWEWKGVHTRKVCEREGVGCVCGGGSSNKEQMSEKQIKKRIGKQTNKQTLETRITTTTITPAGPP
jgi:hypothetical protein